MRVFGLFLIAVGVVIEVVTVGTPGCNPHEARRTGSRVHRGYCYCHDCRFEFLHRRHLRHAEACANEIHNNCRASGNPCWELPLFDPTADGT